MASFLRPTALKLQNFKGIAELELTLDESLTLLAGVNGHLNPSPEPRVPRGDSEDGSSSRQNGISSETSQRREFLLQSGVRA